ncbi:zinc-binding dehydrogenase [Aestuariivirga sp.]|uniref:zinc-binding dehydrogenase n=1 Tax=Aestuariivirga sp. TaxID=2650926 RepID=UPI003919EFB0
MKIKAVVTEGKGGPEVLVPREVELAWPQGPKDVLVRLRAAALNPADVFFRQLGGYIEGPAPFVLGHDGMGTVEAVGAEVTAVRPGERVCFCNGGIGGTMGTYAEAAVVPEAQLAKVPDEVDDLTAAALPLVGITCWESLHDRAMLRPGEFVLIHGGAGGTGHVAVQLASLAGARVAATVSSPEKARIAISLGAEEAINYRETDFVEAALDWSGGVNVAFDNAGAETMQKTFRAMAPYGRVVTLMGTPGDDPDLTAYNLNLTIHNVMMLTPMWKGLGSRLAEQAEIVRRLLAIVAQGQLTIRHAASFPLAEAGKAQALLESGGATGKVTLHMA